MQILDKLITILGFETDEASIREFEKQVESAEKRLNSMGDKVLGVGTGIAAAGAAGTALAGFAVKAAIDWETAWTGVLKTVNGTDAELMALESDLRRMATDSVPLAASELAQIASAAGQLGIQTENISDFTRTMAMLGVTTNLAADEAATQLARLANITNMPQDQFDELGSTIVYLGNNFATTEQEITAMALRLAGAGNLVGLAEHQILAIGTALSSVGINAEAGGTAFSRFLIQMQSDVQSNAAELETWGKVAGVASGEFAGIFTQRGPEEAMRVFLAGLQRMVDEGQDVTPVLEELGFANVRIRDALLRSAGAGDLLANALAAGSMAWEENTALQQEAALRFGTTASQIQFAKNEANEMAITAGEQLVPALKELLAALTPYLEGMTQWIKDHPTATKVLAGLFLGLLAFGGLLIAVGIAMKAAAVIMAIIKGAIVAWTAVQWALNVALTANPIGVIIVGIGLLIAAIIALIVYWDKVVEWVGLAWNKLRSFADSLPGWVTVLLAIFAPFIGIPLLIAKNWETFKAIFDWVITAVKTSWKAFTDFFTNFSLFDAGKAFLETFIDGILAVKDKVVDTVKGVAQDIRDLLPFSNAKIGPLSKLQESGEAFSATFARGIQNGEYKIPESVASVLPSMAAPLPVGPVPAMAGMGGAGMGMGGGQVTVSVGTIQITASGGDAEAIATDIGAAIEEKLREAARKVVEEFDTQIRA